MIKTISDGYIVGILKEGDTDLEYDRLAEKFNSFGTPTVGHMLAMKEDESIVEIELYDVEPELDDSVVVEELLGILGVM